MSLPDRQNENILLVQLDAALEAKVRLRFGPQKQVVEQIDMDRFGRPLLSDHARLA